MRSILIALSLAVATAVPVAAAELVMVRTPECGYCRQWDREIGRSYPATDLGAALPVSMRDLRREMPGRLTLRGPIIYTPTFLIIDRNREVGRIEGYPGRDAFWSRLSGLASRAR